MKKLVLTCIALAFFMQLSAQGYDTAFGLRLGTEWGITLQQRLAKRITVEGIIQSGIRRDETTITGLIERHYPLGPRNINVYLGGGLHKGWVRSNGTDPAPYENPFGITGIAGAEISIGRINASWDFKPAINVTGGEQAVYAQTAVSVRYVINKRKIFDNKNNNSKDREKARAKRKKEREKAKKKRQKEGGGFNWKIWENF